MTDSKRNEKFMAFCLPERQRNIKALIRDQKMREMKKEIEHARNTRKLNELED